MSPFQRLLGALLLGPLLCGAAWAEKLVLATGDWPPYVSPQLRHDGLTARIVREAFREAGYEVELRFFPWPRALLAGEKGQVDGTFIWSHKPEREANFHYSDSVGEYGYVLFHLKSTPFDWRNLDDLRRFKIGGTTSYNYGEEFLQASQDGRLNLEWVSSDELNWRKLLAGRIQLFPQDIYVGYAQLADLFPARQARLVRHHVKPLKPLTSMHLLFPKNLEASPRRLQDFNRGLRRLVAAGTIERFIDEFRETGYRVVSEEVLEKSLKVGP